MASDTSDLQSPSFTYEDKGEYDVILVTTNNWGCTDSVTKVASVRVSPTADFEYTTGCLDEYVSFTDLSFAEEDDQVTAWKWNFGDGSTNEDTSNYQDPAYRYDYLGDKQVELIVLNTIGCRDTMTKLISIHPTPDAGFRVHGNYDNEQGN